MYIIPQENLYSMDIMLLSLLGRHGVTTNPSIMLKDGVYDIEAGAKEIAALINPRPVSVEVTTNDLDKMLRQARTFAQ